MMSIIIIIVILAIIGVLLGKNTFGESVRGGCGCVTAIIFILIVLVVALVVAVNNGLIG